MRTLGILGTGQLGQMLAAAARDLGFDVAVYGPEEGPATRATHRARIAPWDDTAALAAFAAEVDAVTYELEHFPAAALDGLRGHARVSPPAAALIATQDRLLEKRLVASVGLPLAPFLAVDAATRASDVTQAVGFPCLLKSRTGGYDGRGQALARDDRGFDAARGAVGGDAVAEALVPWRRELSVIVARAADGTTVVYPPVENHHVGGVLRWSRAPAPNVSADAERALGEYASRLLHALDYVGVLAMECFETADGIVVNELAPRVHNSGHWTIEGAATSQFENHVRAVMGMPLGSGAARGESLMVNLIGEVPDLAALLALPGARLHLYGKSPRPGRKLGHLTVTAASTEELARAEDALAGHGLLPRGTPPAA